MAVACCHTSWRAPLISIPPRFGTVFGGAPNSANCSVDTTIYKLRLVRGIKDMFIYHLIEKSHEMVKFTGSGVTQSCKAEILHQREAGLEWDRQYFALNIFWKLALARVSQKIWP
jgi:hypothetical protein